MPLRTSFHHSITTGLVACVAVAALGGCTSNAYIADTFTDVSYSALEFRRAGIVPVVVRGDAFVIPQGEFNQFVTDALGTTARFAAAPEGSNATYRVVLMFSPPATLGSGMLCRAELPKPTAAVPAATRVGLSAALCRGDRALTAADGTVATDGGLQGGSFRAGLQQFATVLFPTQNPNKSQSD
jgi:hypothetical protein